MWKPSPLLGAGMILAGVSGAAHGQTISSQVRPILSPSEQQLDYTTAKLALDTLIDPAIDEAGIRRELETLTAQAREIAGPTATDEVKLNAVRRVIYRAGAWNGHNPLAYDQADPLGLNVHNKLLSTYLRTRRGNCVSVPSLFLILADRLGLNVSFATAPLHVFIRYTDPQGRAFNIETTSGANLARPEWLRRNFPMTDRAIRKRSLHANPHQTRGGRPDGSDGDGMVARERSPSRCHRYRRRNSRTFPT